MDFWVGDVFMYENVFIFLRFVILFIVKVLVMCVLGLFFVSLYIDIFLVFFCWYFSKVMFFYYFFYRSFICFFYFVVFNYVLVVLLNYYVICIFC